MYEHQRVFKTKGDELLFHLVRAEYHAQQAYTLMYGEKGLKRSFRQRTAIGKAQNILITWYGRELKRRQEDKKDDD